MLLGTKLQDTVLEEAAPGVGCDIVFILSDIFKNTFANNLTLKFLIWNLIWYVGAVCVYVHARACACARAHVYLCVKRRCFFKQ